MILVDMEMPKSCGGCKASGTDVCTKWMDMSAINGIGYNRHPDCPIKAEIPDNATNGDVIKTMFPNLKLEWCLQGVRVISDNGYGIDDDWWNAPYKVLDGATTIIEATENNNDYTWAKELIKRTGLSIAPEDGSKPYGYDCEDKVWRSDVIDLFGHGSTYTSEEAQKMIKNLPSAEVEVCG